MNRYYVVMTAMILMLLGGCTGCGGGSSDGGQAPASSASSSLSSSIASSVSSSRSSSSTATSSVSSLSSSSALSSASSVSSASSSSSALSSSSVSSASSSSLAPVVTLSSITLTPASLSIKKGQSAVLHCTGSYSDGSTASLDATASYESNALQIASLSGNTLTALAEGSAAVTATVGALRSNTVAVTVLADGTEKLRDDAFASDKTDSVPEDATAEYDPERFCIVSGRVLNAALAPLSDVNVTIHGHPEYGSIRTDVNGTFSLAAESGTRQVVRFDRAGYTMAQRYADLPRRDYARIDDVVLEARDAVVTPVELNGSLQVHRSSTVSDGDGNRAATLVFDHVTQATVTYPDGRSAVLETLDVRATEFRTPEAMPAPLPVTSAFTYCNDLSADGVPADATITFDEPVVMYVDNFLGFDVGTTVPVGHYDYDEAQWVPSENGVVVQLLDRDSDGSVDALDTDGDGQADDLDGDGDLSDEVAGLAGDTAYAPGKTYWRAAVKHFTPWDCNWPYGPPPGATPPNAKQPPNKPGDDDDCGKKVNSYIEPIKRVFHEDIPIAGSTLSLHYASDRTPGYRFYDIDVPVTGDEVPAVLKEVVLDLTVAGQRFKRHITNPQPNQVVTIEWDGKDQSGHTVRGELSARYSLRNLYDAVYYTPRDFSNAFAQAGANPTPIRARQEIAYDKGYKIDLFIPYTEHKAEIAQGWTLSNHDLQFGDWIQKGDGTNVPKTDTLYSIKTVMGNGTAANWSGFYNQLKNGIATRDLLLPEHFIGMVVDSHDDYYIMSRGWVGKAVEDGNVSCWAGLYADGSYYGESDVMVRDWHGDEMNASNNFGTLEDIAIDTDDNIYIVAAYGGHNYTPTIPAHHYIFKIDARTKAVTILLGGAKSVPYDFRLDDYEGQKGVDVYFSDDVLDNMDVDGNGNLYLKVGHQTVEIGADGIMHHIAGKLVPGSSSSADPISVYLGNPKEVSFDWFSADEDGNLYNYLRTNGQYHLIQFDRISNQIVLLASSPPNNTPSSVLFRDAMGRFYGFSNNYPNGNLIERFVVKDGEIVNLIPIAGSDNGSTDDNILALNAKIIGVRYARINSKNEIVFQQNWATIQKLFFDKRSDRQVYYNPDGQIASVLSLSAADPLLEYFYDADGNLVTERNLYGAETLIERDGDGRVTAITAPGGQRTTLQYGSGAQLISVAYEDGSGYGFTYDADGLMTQMTDPNGNAYDHVFDDKGRIIRALDPEGGSWDFTLNTVGTTLDYAITSALGNEEHYIFHDQNGSSRTSEHILPCGTRQTIVNVDGGTQITSTLCGMTKVMKEMLDPFTGLFTQSELSMRTPAGLTITTQRSDEYNISNSVGTSRFVTNGQTVTIVEDYANGTVTTTSAEGRVESESYDPATLETLEHRVGTLHPITYGYNTQGLLASVTTGERRTDLTYNSRYELTQEENALHETTAYSYDLLGRVTQKNFPDGGSETYTYDAAGNLLTLTTPNGFTHRYNYNGVHNKESATDALNHAAHYTYDKERLLTGVELPSGKTVSYRYDKGRLVSVTTPEKTLNYTYACQNNIASVSDGNESVSYTYDGILTTRLAFTGTLDAQITFSYNSDFTPASATYAGKSENYGYDTDRLLTSAGDYALTRNSNGFVTALAGTGFTETFAYDGYGDDAGFDCSVNSAAPYAYTISGRDKAGRILSVEERIGGETIAWAYAYDANGRLTEVKRNGSVSETYAYDANGNRTRFNTLTATFSENDSILSIGDRTYRFDADGYLETMQTAAGETAYTYNVLGELRSVVLPDGRTITYYYTPTGNLLAKKIDGVLAYTLLWKDPTTLLAVYDGGGSVLKRFRYADGRLPVSVEMGSSTYLLAYNQTGSLRALIDTNGVIVKRINYDAYGNVVADSNTSLNPMIGFAGGFYDSDTKLTHFGRRDYDAYGGLWTARDPIGLESGDSNFYRYVENDPVNLVDPEGLSVIDGVKGGKKIKDKVDAYKDWKDIYDKCKKLKDSTDCISKAGESGDAEDMVNALRKNRNRSSLLHDCAKAMAKKGVDISSSAGL